MKPIVSPAERIREFFQRLQQAMPFASFTEAWTGLAALLHQVEDEFSGIERNRDETNEAPNDGRMYPPHLAREFADVLGVRSFRQKRHITSFAENGAIEIVDLKDGRPIVLNKPGADGRTVSDYRRPITDEEQNERDRKPAE